MNIISRIFKCYWPGGPVLSDHPPSNPPAPLEKKTAEKRSQGLLNMQQCKAKEQGNGKEL